MTKTEFGPPYIPHKSLLATCDLEMLSFDWLESVVKLNLLVSNADNHVILTFDWLESPVKFQLLVGNACLENVHAQSIASNERACVFDVFWYCSPPLVGSSAACCPSVALIVVHFTSVVAKSGAQTPSTKEWSIGVWERGFRRRSIPVHGRRCYSNVQCFCGILKIPEKQCRWCPPPFSHYSYSLKEKTEEGLRRLVEKFMPGRWPLSTEADDITREGVCGRREEEKISDVGSEDCMDEAPFQ